MAIPAGPTASPKAVFHHGDLVGDGADDLHLVGNHEVLELLRKVNRDLGITIVVITHEMEVVSLPKECFCSVVMPP